MTDLIITVVGLAFIALAIWVALTIDEGRDA